MNTTSNKNSGSKLLTNQKKDTLAEPFDGVELSDDLLILFLLLPLLDC